MTDKLKKIEEMLHDSIWTKSEYPAFPQYVINQHNAEVRKIQKVISGDVVKIEHGNHCYCGCGKDKGGVA